MQNVLTIDLEEWYHANYRDGLFDNSNQYEQRVVRNTETLLQLLDRHQAKATFFTLGLVAKQHPDLLKRIQEKGHEIASHGYGHQLIYKQSETEFEEDLQKSIYYIERATGTSPKGYRAPSWSVKKDTPWVYPVLQRNGIRYDASIFPIKTYLYGIPDAPRLPFHLEFAGGTMLEFPTSTVRFATKNIPFSGGFYFRFLPYPFIRSFFKRINCTGSPVIFYLHPREIDPEQPRLKSLNARDTFIHYYQVGHCFGKLNRLLSEFSFSSMEQFILNHTHHFDRKWHLTALSSFPVQDTKGKETIHG